MMVDLVVSECTCGFWHVTDDSDDAEIFEDFATEEEAIEFIENQGGTRPSL
jgi:hypothetical protein